MDLDALGNLGDLAGFAEAIQSAPEAWARRFASEGVDDMVDASSGR